MSNANGRGLQISDFNPQVPSAANLPDIQRVGSPSADTAFSVATALSDRVGKLGDVLAQAEGEKAGKIAGADPNWRPSEDMTIKGRAFDKSASEVYLSKLASNFQGDALDLYQKNKDDPAAFKTAYEGLVGQYKRQHVFPEAGGWFDAKAGDIANSLRTKVLSNWEENRKDQQRASLIRDQEASDANSARLLAIDPHSPETERNLLRDRDEKIARVRASVEAGTITAAAGEKMIIAAGSDFHTRIISARAETLKSPEEIDAYRAKLRKEFGEGKLAGLSDFNSIDSQLAQLGKARRVQADHDLRAFDGQLTDFLDRHGKGNEPPASEWLSLEAQAKALGPSGAVALDGVRSKLALRQELSRMSVNEGEALLSRLSREAKDSAGLAPEQQKAIGLTAQRLGISAGDLRAIISYETGGTFNTGKWGGKEGKYLGLIQFGPEEQRTYGVKPGQSFDEQMAAVERYFIDRGVRSGDDLKTLYKIVNGGNRNVSDNASDGNGTIVEHVAKIAREHGGGLAKAGAEVLDDGRAYVSARRSLIAQDPLAQGERDKFIPQASPVDFAAAPDVLGAQMQARVAQAETVANAYQRPPMYIRPDEKPAVQAVLKGGGDKALGLIDGIVRGAGPRALKVLNEIGGDAPEMAHAGAVSLSTGDRSFARQVAEGMAARDVKGGMVPKVDDASLADYMRKSFGPALQGLDSTARERTLAAAKVWAEREFARRNTDPSTDGNAEAIYREALQRARGQSVVNGVKYGGVAEVEQAGFLGGAVQVQIPADVRADRFGDALAALTDDDLKGLKNPPILSNGKVMPAAQLRKSQIFKDEGGGYTFGTLDKTHGVITPLKGRDGSTFVLPWDEFAPILRQRLPSAFR